MSLILFIVLILVIIAVLPHWPYSSGWGVGYYPSGIIGVLLIILIVLLLLGRI